MRGLATLLAAVLVWTKFLGVCEPDVNVNIFSTGTGLHTKSEFGPELQNLPAKTRCEIQTLLGAALSFELEADVQHRIRFLRDITATFTFYVALQKACKYRVDDADALQMCRPS